MKMNVFHLKMRLRPVVGIALAVVLAGVVGSAPVFAAKAAITTGGPGLVLNEPAPTFVTAITSSGGFTPPAYANVLPGGAIDTDTQLPVGFQPPLPHLSAPGTASPQTACFTPAPWPIQTQPSGAPAVETVGTATAGQSCSTSGPITLAADGSSSLLLSASTGTITSDLTAGFDTLPVGDWSQWSPYFGTTEPTGIVPASTVTQLLSAEGYSPDFVQSIAGPINTTQTTAPGQPIGITLDYPPQQIVVGTSTTGGAPLISATFSSFSAAWTVDSATGVVSTPAITPSPSVSVSVMGAPHSPNGVFGGTPLDSEFFPISSFQINQPAGGGTPQIYGSEIISQSIVVDGLGLRAILGGGVTASLGNSAQLAPTSGAFQTGTVGAPLALPITATVTPGSIPWNGQVTFSVGGSGMTVSATPGGTQLPAVTVTPDSSGVATVYASGVATGPSTIFGTLTDHAAVSYPETITSPTCPTGYTGTYPDCVPPVVPTCPTGYTGTYPDCVPPVVPTCPSTDTGTYPDCVPPAPLVLTLTGSGSQTVAPGQTYPVRLIATVTRGGQLVSGVVVRFSLPIDSGLTFDGPPVVTADATTGTNGQASSPPIVAGFITGQFTATAIPVGVAPGSPAFGQTVVGSGSFALNVVLAPLPVPVPVASIPVFDPTVPVAPVAQVSPTIAQVTG